MSVKSLSIAEWGNIIVTEPVAHWWKPAAIAVLRLEKSQAMHRNKALNATDSPLLESWVSGYYGRTNKGKIDDWGPKTQLQLPIITIGAAKDNKMKIFELITLSLCLFYNIRTHSSHNLRKSQHDSCQKLFYCNCFTTSLLFTTIREFEMSLVVSATNHYFHDHIISFFQSFR